MRLHIGGLRTSSSREVLINLREEGDADARVPVFDPWESQFAHSALVRMGPIRVRPNYFWVVGSPQNTLGARDPYQCNGTYVDNPHGNLSLAPYAHRQMLGTVHRQNRDDIEIWCAVLHRRKISIFLVALAEAGVFRR